MTLPPEKIGDRGQRYFVRARNAQGAILNVGYSANLEGAQQMAKAMTLHPTYNQPEIIDRNLPRRLPGT